MSGSWVIKEKVLVRSKESFCLQGHTGTVWATWLLPEVGLMLTGGAEKTMRVWMACKQVHCLTSHIDAVRSLAAVIHKDQVSCYNLHLILAQLTFIVPVCL